MQKKTTHEMCNFRNKYQVNQIADAKGEHTYDKLQKVD